MVTLQELIGKTPLEQIPKSHQNNLNILLQRINIIRKEYNKPMTVTSGYRSESDHLRIYKELAEKRKQEFDKNKIPWGSGHLKGECVDISDPNGELKDWLLKNLDLCKKVGLWLEDFRYTKGWVHFGIQPPVSKKRIFIPYSGPAPYPNLWNGIYPDELN